MVGDEKHSGHVAEYTAVDCRTEGARIQKPVVFVLTDVVRSAQAGTTVTQLQV